MTEPTRTEIEQLGRLAERATRAPWGVAPEALGQVRGAEYDVCQCVQTKPIRTAADHEERRDNANFIAAARNTVPQLCRLALRLMERTDPPTADSRPGE